MTDITVQLPKELKGLEGFIQQLMDEWKVPGLALAIAKDGEIVLEKGYGLRDVERNLPITTDTILAIGSSSKAFATMSLATLVDDGKVDWDTPVREYLPDFRLYDQVATERMTPRDLVTHRSGLPRHDLLWYRSRSSRQELFHRLRYLQPNTDFRSYAQYQNLMYMTAGYLAGEIEGTTWEEVVRQRVFRPLGMTRSIFDYAEMEADPNHALPYRRNRETDEVELMPYYGSPGDQPIDAVGPAGSIKASVHDMSQWLLLHLNGGKHGNVQVVSEGQLAQMHAPQMVFPQFNSKYEEKGNVSYGMGWFIQSYRGINTVHHGGNIDGFTALVSFAPQHRLGFVLLINQDGSPIRETLADYIYDHLLGMEPIDWNERIRADWAEMKAAGERAREKTEIGRVKDAPPSHPLDDYTGEFEHPGYGRITIERDGDDFKVKFNTIEFSLKHYHYDIFELSFERFGFNFKTSFSTNVKGDIDTFSAPLEASVPSIVFTRVASSAMTERSFLERLAGPYDLNGDLVAVSIKGDGALILKMRGRPEIEFTPYKGTEFVARDVPELSIEFKLDEGGAVTELVVSTIGGVFSATPRKEVGT